MLNYQEYIQRKIIRETEKAYLVEQEVNNLRDGHHINFKWTPKKVCRESNTPGYVMVPEWVVSNGIWNR